MSTQSEVLSTRFELHDKPYLTLSRSQGRARNSILRKISEGLYSFQLRPCQLCGSENFQLLARRDRYSLPVTTVLCMSCGLLSTNPVMREADYADFYVNHYTDLYDGFQFSAAEFFDNQRLASRRLSETVLKHVQLEGRLLAEVGCAAGGILAHFRELGVNVIGCDYGTAFLSHGKLHGLDVRQGGLSTIAPERPDAVLYSHVLEHIYDVNQELRQVYDLLPIGGHLIVDVPGIYNIEPAYGGDFLNYLQNAHLYHFSASTLTALMAKCGFEALYVDERCIGVYRKSARGPVMVAVDAGEASRVKKFLAGLEKVVWLRRLRSIPRETLVRILKALGLHRFTRGVWRRLRRG